MFGEIIFSDLREALNATPEQLIIELWSTDKKVYNILIEAKNIHEAREALFSYLNNLERQYFSSYSDKHAIHVLERNNAKECIRILKNIIRTENEQLTENSALQVLYDLAHQRANNVHKGFLLELMYLLKGINGQSEIYRDTLARPVSFEGRQGANKRCEQLDQYAAAMTKVTQRYHAQKNVQLQQDILKYFGGTTKDWNNYIWHIAHVIKDLKTLRQLITLEPDERIGLEYAEQHNIPFHITPYYLSLFNKNGRTRWDEGLRAQVLPSLEYCKQIAATRNKNIDLDFMGEHSTSPIDCITRRYAQICILKPFDSCPQFCVYCQRNWEIKTLEDASVSQEKIIDAVNWIKQNKYITEVLITGGDPLTTNNNFIGWVIAQVAAITHVERIRIGTRTLVTIPYRINDGLLAILKRYHQWGKREICVVTHFEHPAELTPESQAAITRLKNIGINVYNQQVYTYFTSKRFQTCYLRQLLKKAGVDPYYTFNTKGKEETIDFRVPIARILQERKEEARLLPGIIRTDEPVFNVPKLGKSHLRALQDHEPIMILPDGRRIYRFYPWENKITLTNPYLYTDVSITEYLERLADDGENVNEYQSIWYYY